MDYTLPYFYPVDTFDSLHASVFLLTPHAVLPTLVSGTASVFNLYTPLEFDLYPSRRTAIYCDVKITMPPCVYARIDPLFDLSAFGIDVMPYVVTPESADNVRIVIANHTNVVFRATPSAPLAHISFLSDPTVQLAPVLSDATLHSSVVDSHPPVHQMVELACLDRVHEGFSVQREFKTPVIN